MAASWEVRRLSLWGSLAAFWVLFEGTSPEKDFFRVALAFDALFGDFWASLDFFLACLWVALGWFW